MFRVNNKGTRTLSGSFYRFGFHVFVWLFYLKYMFLRKTATGVIKKPLFRKNHSLYWKHMLLFFYYQSQLGGKPRLATLISCKFCQIFENSYLHSAPMNAEGYLEPCQTSKKERFSEIVNGFQPLTISKNAPCQMSDVLDV